MGRPGLCNSGQMREEEDSQRFMSVVNALDEMTFFGDGNVQKAL
jgi:hypothetical protein